MSNIIVLIIIPSSARNVCGCRWGWLRTWFGGLAQLGRGGMGILWAWVGAWAWVGRSAWDVLVEESREECSGMSARDVLVEVRGGGWVGGGK